jgi:hypothetical protein
MDNEDTSPPIPRRWIPKHLCDIIPKSSLDGFNTDEETFDIHRMLNELKKSSFKNKVESLKDKIIEARKSMTNTQKIQNLTELLKDIDQFYTGNKYNGFYTDGWLEMWAHEYILYLDKTNVSIELTQILLIGTRALDEYDNRYYSIL